MASESQDQSVLIVGAGMFGVSTAFHLANVIPPSSITIVDRHPFPSPPADSKKAPYGASHDINKIVRADYSNAFYMQLAQEAIEQWRTWDVVKPFYHNTGWIMLDEEKSDLAQRIRQNFKTCGVGDDTRDLSFEEVKSSWGGLLKNLDVKGFGTAYWNPGAGWAEADKAVEAMLKAAVDKGVKYHQGRAADLLLRDAGDTSGVAGVKLENGHELHAQKVVLASGAWTSKLMANIETTLNIAEQYAMKSQVLAAGVCVVHFELDETEKKRYDELPVIIYGANGELLPPPPSRLLKFTNAGSFTNRNLGSHTQGGGTQRNWAISVPAESQHEVPEALKLETLDIVRRIAPSVITAGYRVAFWRLCWDAITPEQHQLITKHPDQRLSNLYLAIGGSFHSWKFLPTIGKYVANVVEGQSNGEEKDQNWSWKSEGWGTGPKKGAHEKVIPKRDLSDLA